MIKKVKISNQKLAQIIHMELIARGYDHDVADEYFEEVSQQNGHVILRETDGIEFFEECEAE